MLSSNQLNSILSNALAEILATYGSKVVKVVLFGSYAKGTAKQSSDIDILILTTHTINSLSNMFALADMMERLTAKHGKEIHLITEAIEYYQTEAEEWLIGVKGYGVVLYTA